ncbi:MAG: HDIG domain-containing protein [Deferribacteres bacterium]|nr:HDIG domain-containing protein [candidate division KSB1 bacterium]MCB9504429.1 HDIG domain-containing protein [Deferribacteres bacterium]
MTRNDAYTLMTQWTENDNLRRHMLAVEAAMVEYARKYKEDEELWAVVGLLHDMDYEKHPTAEEHPYVAVKYLQEQGVSEEITHAILAHASYTGVTPVNLMEKVLLAVDELCGFVTACVYVRPSRSIHDLTPKSVKKKMKSIGFSRAVNREDITKGAELLGVSLDEHIQTVIDGMRRVADDLDLAGTLEHN